MQNSDENGTFNGSLGTYKLVETDDGSQTLYSDYFQEACHSQAGAIAETLHNYVEGTEVPKRLKLGPLSVFEVGFATGIGLRVTLTHVPPEDLKNLHFVSSELDELLTVHSLKELKKQGLISSFEKCTKESLSYYQAEIYPSGDAFILIGDVRETLVKWITNSKFKEFNCIYQDPFSPKRNPRLWTTEWFSDLKKACASNVILGTYSSTKAVWKAMMAAGWKVYEVKGYGQKRLSTRARLGGESSPNVIDWCKRSPSPALSDATLS